MAENDVTESAITGARIRERRIAAGIRQAELAERAGISASYLNLIEHNRRRIGGRILLRIAAVLGVEPTLLTRGAAAGLVAGLREAAVDMPEDAPDRAKPEEFAERFPEWAGLLLRTRGKVDALERAVRTLTDRLAHDPNLAERLHEVLSVVTAIRSTASILVDTPELERDWQRRFHRNINEDSARLAEGAEALVRYLDAAPDDAEVILSPQDELDAFLEAHGYHFPALEDGTERDVLAVLAAADHLTSDAARNLAELQLMHYLRDARRLPLADLEAALAALGPDPLALAARCGVSPGLAFRRLAALPTETAGELGYALCDGSGVLVMRRPVAGFSLPRLSGGCPIWPLYAALAQPGTPLRLRVAQVGPDRRVFTASAFSEVSTQTGYNQPPPRRAYMLLVPAAAPAAAASPVTAETDAEAPIELGVTCRVCTRASCAARREPSILREEF